MFNTEENCTRYKLLSAFGNTEKCEIKLLHALLNFSDEAVMYLIFSDACYFGFVTVFSQKNQCMQTGSSCYITIQCLSISLVCELICGETRVTLISYQNR